MRVALAGPVRVETLLPWLHVDDDERRRVASLRASASPVTELAVGLLERGHELVVVSLDPAVADEVVLRGPRLRVRVGPYRARGRARDAFKEERAYVREALRAERPELVHAHWHYEYALGALASGRPTLTTVRDWAPTIWRLQRPKHYLTVRLGMATFALLRGQHFTVASPYMQQRVQRWSRRPVTVIPNAVPDGAFAVRERPPDLAAPLLLAVNQGFSHRKNVKTLLQAFATVRAERPTARLVLGGTRYGPGEPAHQWAAASGLDAGVDFRGELDHGQITRLMREADLFVHPSLEESFGMVLVEAMAQGLPVVAGRRSGAVPWVLGEGRAGVLCDVTSADALANAILRPLADPGAWAQLSAAGFAEAQDRFRLPAVVGQYEAAYERVLDASGRQSGRPRAARASS